MSVYFATSAALFVLGFMGLILRKQAMVRLMALNLMGIGIFLWLINWARSGCKFEWVIHIVYVLVSVRRVPFLRVNKQ